MINNPELYESDRRETSKAGVIDPGKVKTALFILSSGCVAICVVMSILAIWDYVGNDAAFKMIASSGVLGAGAVLFDLLNRKFG